MTLHTLLLKRKDQLLIEKYHLESRMKQFPDGNLVCHKSKGANKTYCKWYQVFPPKSKKSKRIQIYLHRSERPLAAELLKKQICSASLGKISQELKAIDAYLKIHPAAKENAALAKLLRVPQCKDLFDQETLSLLMASGQDYPASDHPENPRIAKTPETSLRNPEVI